MLVLICMHVRGVHTVLRNALGDTAHCQLLRASHRHVDVRDD